MCSLNGMKKHAILKHDLVKLPRKNVWRRVARTERDTLIAKYSAWATAPGQTKTTPSVSVNAEVRRPSEGPSSDGEDTAADTVSARAAITDCMLSSAAGDAISESSDGVRTPTFLKSPRREATTRVSTPPLFGDVSHNISEGEGEPDSSTEDVGDDTTGVVGASTDTGIPMTTMATGPPVVSICENVPRNIPMTSGNEQSQGHHLCHSP